MGWTLGMMILFVWASNTRLYGVPSGLASSMPSDIMRIVLASGHGTVMDLGKRERKDASGVGSEDSVGGGEGIGIGFARPVFAADVDLHQLAPRAMQSLPVTLLFRGVVVDYRDGGGGGSWVPIAHAHVGR